MISWCPNQFLYWKRIRRLIIKICSLKSDVQIRQMLGRNSTSAKTVCQDSTSLHMLTERIIHVYLIPRNVSEICRQQAALPNLSRSIPGQIICLFNGHWFVYADIPLLSITTWCLNAWWIDRLFDCLIVWLIDELILLLSLRMAGAPLGSRKQQS